MNNRVKQSFFNARIAIISNLAIMVLSFVSRKVWIDHLGTELTGMSSAVNDLLGFLNIAELGILAAISYTLYKPIADDDRNRINDIVSLLGYLYRIIGWVILGGGLVMSAFLPMLFADRGVGLGMIYMSFYTFLGVNLLGYFFNYKQNLLLASHRNWVMVATNGGVTVLKISVQMALLIIFDMGYVSWLVVEALFGVIYTLWINHSIRRIFPWLNASTAHGRRVKHQYKEVLIKTRQVFSHKIAGFVLNQSDSVVISVVQGFAMVTEVGNYQLIFNRVVRLIFTAVDNLSAGVGSLVAEGDRQRTRMTYDQLNAMFYFIGGVVIICGWLLTEPVIRLWLGAEFITNKIILALILLNIYIQILRRPQDVFLSVHGIFHDIWAPWSEAILNLAISIVAGYYWGVEGVLLGTFVSTLLIAIIWKPILLFREAFGEGVWGYWRHGVLYLALTAVVGTVADRAFVAMFDPSEWDNLLVWLLWAGVVFIVVAGALGGAMYLCSAGMRKFVHVTVEATILPIARKLKNR